MHETLERARGVALIQLIRNYHSIRSKQRIVIIYDYELGAAEVDLMERFCVFS